jgi:hypothetical protein
MRAHIMIMTYMHAHAYVYIYIYTNVNKNARIDIRIRITAAGSRTSRAIDEYINIHDQTRNGDVHAYVRMHIDIDRDACM